MLNDQEREKQFWKLLLHTENTFTNRTNFFMVAQAMFLVAYATVVDRKLENEYPLILFKCAGLIIGLIWLFLGHRTYEKLGQLSSEIRGRNLFPEYTKWREYPSKCISANLVIGIIIPSGFILLWLFLQPYRLTFIKF